MIATDYEFIVDGRRIGSPSSLLTSAIWSIAKAASGGSSTTSTHCILSKLGIHLLSRLLQHPYKRTSMLEIVRGEECDGSAKRVCPSRPTNAMHIVLDAIRKVVIDDILDVLDIQSTSGNIRGDHHWAATTLELGEHPVAFLLGLVTMDGKGGEVIGLEAEGDLIRGPLRAREYEDL